MRNRSLVMSQDLLRPLLALVLDEHLKCPIDLSATTDTTTIEVLDACLNSAFSNL